MTLTQGELDALRSVRDHDNIGYHIKGRSASGGFTRTRNSLRRKILIDWQNRLTDTGRAALEAAEKAK